MSGRTVLKVFFAILAVVTSHAEGVVTFSSNGYKDVVVSISPNVDGADQNVTVDNIKVKPTTIICQMACCYYLRHQWATFKNIEWDSLLRFFLFKYKDYIRLQRVEFVAVLFFR